MLSKRERLTVRDIERLSAGKSAFTALISMRYAPADRLKMSVSVSKKTAPRAADRNRIRRRTYSLLRELRGDIRVPVFALLSPKKEFRDAPREALLAEVRLLLAKARLV